MQLTEIFQKKKTLKTFLLANSSISYYINSISYSFAVKCFFSLPQVGVGGRLSNFPWCFYCGTGDVGYAYNAINVSNCLKGKKMANDAYNLAPGEETFFELEINNPSRSDADNPIEFVANIIKALLPCCNKAAALLVVTNMRILVTTNPTCCGSEDKFFWSFPRTALNGNNSFSMTAGQFSCCDKYVFSIGISFGLSSDFNLCFETDNVRSIDQAQALIAKFFQLSQNA